MPFENEVSKRIAIETINLCYGAGRGKRGNAALQDGVEEPSDKTAILTQDMDPLRGERSSRGQG
jgi:hypothetical protein